MAIFPYLSEVNVQYLEGASLQTYNDSVATNVSVPSVQH